MFAYLKDGIGAGATVTAGRLEAPRVQHEKFAIPLKTGSMRVPVDDAVGFGEKAKKSILNVKAKAGTMGKADAEPAKGKELPGRIEFTNRFAAHVAVNGDNPQPRKGIEDRRVGHVAGVDDQIAALKTVADLFFKPAVRTNEVGVGKNACFDDHGKWVA